MTELHVRCPLCQAVGARHYLAVQSYSIVQCFLCGFLFVSPPPDADALAAFYQQESYYIGSAFGYQDYFAQRPSHERDARRRLGIIEQLTQQRGQLLDVGCAAGFFLHVAQRRGWQPAGVELSSSMAAFAADLVHCPIVARTDQLMGAPATFDVITFWEYIEHIPDPYAELCRLVPLLRPGGILALSTPNTRYWTAVHRPDRWREFKPPAHIGFFTTRTLRRLIEMAGLEVVLIRKVFPRAPSHPYLLQRLLLLLKARVGNGADRRTRVWWSFSIMWRVVERLSQLGYRVRWPSSDVGLCLEVYARKPVL